MQVTDLLIDTVNLAAKGSVPEYQVRPLRHTIASLQKAR